MPSSHYISLLKAQNKLNNIRPRFCPIITFKRKFLVQSCISNHDRVLSEVDLKFDSFKTKDDFNTKEPERLLVIVHGLFGSKQNWSSLGKAFQSYLNDKNYSIYTLDLRNHGDSPHNENMDYISMANDIASFIKRIPTKSNLPREISLLGHSLGGRVAMTYALASISEKINSFPSLRNLIVVDISPGKINLRSQFGKYINIMQRVEDAKLKKQSEADAMLKEGGIEELGIRQFLLTNYKKAPDGSGFYHFRNPLDILESQLENLGQVDTVYLNGVNYKQPSLFIAGSRSTYIPNSEHANIKSLFPNAIIKSIDAGHWVHAEKPREFLDIVCDFLNQ